MGSSIDKKQIEAIDKIFHKILRMIYKKEFFSFSGKFQDITPIEMAIISSVVEKPDIILKEILEGIEIPNSTLTNLINRLENSKILKRTINARDRRSFGLELTEKGKAAHQEHLNTENRLFETILKALDNPEERDVFLKLAEKVSNRLVNVKDWLYPDFPTSQ